MKRTKVLSLLLALFMLVLSPGFTTTTFADNTVELEFYSLKPETVNVMEEIIADFMVEYPDIKITLTSVSDAGTVLMTRIATNEIPDILNVYPAEDKYKAMFDDGLIVDVTDMPFMSNVSDTMRDMARYNGKEYALPMTLSSYGIYYRTDIFEKLGLAEPATYADLLTVCKTLKENGYDAFALPNKDVGNVAQRLERSIGVMNHNSDEEFQKIANGEMKVEDSQTIRAFAQLCMDILPYSTEDSLGLDYESAVADLVNGKAAMMISGTWMLSTMQASNPDIEVKLIPIPSPLYDELSVPVNIDTSYAVSTACKHPEEALKFLEYMSRTDVAQKYYAVDGNVNMIKGVTYDKEEHMYMKELMDKGQMFLTQVNFWPTGLREEMRPAGQQLYVDKNIDNFITAFGEAIMKLYNQ